MTMDRQLGPSIVLSVLIVCFFAVALFQHDAPRSSADHKPALAGGVPDVVGPVPIARRDTSAPSSSGSVLRSSASAGPVVSSVNRSIDRDVSDRKAEHQTDRAIVASGSLNLRPASGRSPSSAVASYSSTARVRGAVEHGVTRRPRSAFTVVEADETIADVAVRVYGTADQVELIREANRDSLPRADMPISAGMLLRTPRIR
jgi:hypothetical protein